jgi:ABC-type antimicrobial peptide transport system permease subunit
MRRVLVVIQYTFTMVFITATAIGYTQYKSILAFDLGFNTANILNISMKGNNADNLIKAFEEIPEVTGASKSSMITSVGNYWGGHMKYKKLDDSTMVWYNKIDENYLPLHGHKLLAGRNFISHPATEAEATEVIVNEQVLKKFEIAKGDPDKALGEEVLIDRHKYQIVGVLRDFHYGKVESKIDPVVMMMYLPEKNGYINLKIESNDPVATMAKVESAWKQIDKIHPIEAKFYSDQIEKAYSEFSAMIKIIGFLSFLAISIASMGLFGMVVFTTETRLKEISIRKVMGASSGNLVLLLSRGFLVLLSISAAVAIPATYFFFEGVVLAKFPYHNPIQVSELFVGLVVVLIIAIIMIGSQTMKAARSNPAEVLKSE